MPTPRPLLIANACDATSMLASAIDAQLLPLPAIDDAAGFAAWRSDVASGPAHPHLVIALWREHTAGAQLSAVNARQWQQRFEEPFLAWNFALGAASRRVADGGALVALVQAPAALDAAGWTAELAIADGVLSLVRSVAAAEGGRGVRANLVTTPLGLVGGEIIPPEPPLAVFPGTLAGSIAGAVRAFLSDDACGLTGRVLAADGGRSL